MKALQASPAARRIPHVDALRLIGLFLVLVNHTNSQLFLSETPSPIWYVSLTWFYVSRCAVAVFLMLTGAMSLGRPVDWSRYPRRVWRAVAVLIAANLVYYGAGLLRGTIPEFSAEKFVKALFQGSSNALWYLYLYVACMVFMPFFQKLTAAMDRREERYLLILAVGLCGLFKLLPIVWRSMDINAGYNCTAINAYIGLMFAGHYIEKYCTVGRKTAWLAAGCFLALVAAEVVGTRLIYDDNPNGYVDISMHIQITVTGAAICLYLVVKHLLSQPERCPRLSRVLTFLGPLTFGAYLLGDLAIDLLAPIYPALAETLPRFVSMVIYELAVFLACLGATFLLRRIPLLRRYL